MYQLRQMKLEDVAALARIQVECYSPMMQEDEATLRDRYLLAPDTAWVAEDEEGVCAYLVGYRSVVGKITPLNEVFELPQRADTLYLHDLSVGTRCRGRGVGQALVQLACQQAEEEGLTYSALVSVQGSRDFWQRLGYVEWAGLEPAQLANLRTYEQPAYHMVRKLAGPGRDMIAAWPNVT